jgi:peptidoglycan/xylan/chitin deacetylase (PgdA/CDA1 family)
MSKAMRTPAIIARGLRATASLLPLAAASAAAALVYHLAFDGSKAPAPALSPARPAASSMTYGVSTALLERGKQDSDAAVQLLLNDPTRRPALRALDERMEAWEVSRMQYPYLAWGPPDRKEVLLTFDDGPDPSTTPLILETLRREKVPALFFVVGQAAADHPELLRQEAAEGHAIGNHTWHHVYLTKMEPDCARAQIQATANAVRAVVGLTTAWFRPPGGHYDAAVVPVLRELRQQVVLWTDNPMDWLRSPPRELLLRTLQHLRPGAIILLHDTIPETAQMLPELIRAGRARGYQFVPISRFAPYVRGLAHSTPGRAHPRAR